MCGRTVRARSRSGAWWCPRRRGEAAPRQPAPGSPSPGAPRQPHPGGPWLPAPAGPAARSPACPAARSRGPAEFHVKSKLERLVDRYSLGDGQRAQLEAILDLLAADERAPTAVRDPAAAVDVHIADSLVALELGVLATATQIADVGAGAG